MGAAKLITSVANAALVVRLVVFLSFNSQYEQFFAGRMLAAKELIAANMQRQMLFQMRSELEEL